MCCFLGAFYLQRQLLQRQQASSALPTCVLHPQWEWETKVEWTRGLASHPSNRLLSQPSPRALTPTLLSEPRSAACRVFPSRSSLSAHRRRGHGGLRWTLLESAPDLRGPSQAIGGYFRLNIFNPTEQNPPKTRGAKSLRNGRGARRVRSVRNKRNRGVSLVSDDRSRRINLGLKMGRGHAFRAFGHFGLFTGTNFHFLAGGKVLYRAY